MDDLKNYSSFAIPPRRGGGVAVLSQGERQPESAFHSDGFAEIEINSGPAKATAAERALYFFSSFTQPEPIEQRAHDPIRMRFYDMRSLATNRPFARDDSELFYKQAKFMEGFTDDYGGDAGFFMYYPYYQHMGYEQLRTYFTWRTKARNGEMPPTSASYVFLYVYELLNNIGVADPQEGLDKLLAIWNTCLSFAPALENYMPRWFKDYHIYYDMPQGFTDFIKENGLLKHFSEMFLFSPDIEDRLETWNNLSAYDVTKSKFYNDGNESLFKDCFGFVLDGIDEMCELCSIDIEELIIYSHGKRMPWKPFKQALFYSRPQQSDREVEVPGGELYYCKNGAWTVNVPIYYSTQREFIGYILKKTESCLRQTHKYKYKLTAEPTTRQGAPFRELYRFGIPNDELEETIEEAVAGFHRERNRTVVTVDHANLERIREEAQGTQEKLSVEDDDRGQGTGDRGQKTGDSDAPEMAGIIGSMGAEHLVSDEPQMGWLAFRDALSEVELEALTLVLSGSGGIKAFADENGIMLEVLADRINEKAADFIGDSILETDDGMTIYDEYRDLVEWVKEGVTRG